MKIQCLILPDTYTTFYKHVLMELIIQKINSKFHILLNAICFWKYNYWEQNSWKYSLLIFIGRPCDISKMKEVKSKATTELTSDLYLNVWIGEKNTGEYTLCESGAVRKNTMYATPVKCYKYLEDAGKKLGK